MTLFYKLKFQKKKVLGEYFYRYFFHLYF